MKLGSPKEATDVYTNLIDNYAKTPEFQKNPKASTVLYTTRLRKVKALRLTGNLPEAETQLEELIKENARSLEAMIEKGYLTDAKATAGKATWLESYNYWKGLATRLSNASPKPIQYYESWYQAALAVKKLGDVEKDTKKQQTDYTLARSTLASVMRLSPAVGSPEMKSKYDSLLKQLPR